MNIFRELRLKAGLRQVDVARIARIDSTHLSEIECGKHRPTKGTLYGLAKALKVPVDCLGSEYRKGMK